MSRLRRQVSVFECARCNALTYSASRAATYRCETCGSPKARILVDETFDTAEDVERTPHPRDHCAAVYRGPQAGAALAAPFIVDGLARGDQVIAQLCSRVRAELETTLAPDVVQATTWIDAEVAYGPGFEPEEAAARVRQAAHSAPRRLRLVGNLHAGIRDGMPADTLRRYERLAQDVAVDHEVTALCLYDAEIADDEYLAVCRDTHPLVARDERLRRNPAFAWSPSC